jgi:PKD repeat protein
MRSALRFSVLTLCLLTLTAPTLVFGSSDSDRSGDIACNAQFEFEIDGLVVHFINQSTSDGEIVSYHWDFGDGHMGDGQNPTHTYDEPGGYLVCLTIEDNQGCTDTQCHDFALQGGECNAQFEFEINGL